MNRNMQIMISYAAIAVLTAVFLVLAVRTYTGFAESKRAATFAEAKASGSSKTIAKTGGSLLSSFPDDHNLKLLVAHHLVNSGKHKSAMGMYETITKGRAPDEIKAAAAVGKAAVLLSRASPPAREDVEKAVALIENADGASRLADAGAILAVAKLWLDDIDGAKEAASQASKASQPATLEPSISLYCAKAFIAGREGNAHSAKDELASAHLLQPNPDSRVGGYVEQSLASMELETTLSPDATSTQRAALLKIWKEKTAQPITLDEDYRGLLRAGISYAFSKTRGESDAGAKLLKVAATSRPDDPAPAMALATVAFGKIERYWKQAETRGDGDEPFAAGAVAVLDMLPGASASKTKAKRRSSANSALKTYIKREEPVVVAVRDVIERALRSDDVDTAFGAAKRLMLWKLKQIDLAKGSDQQKTIALAAVDTWTWITTTFGDRLPESRDAAVFMRNCGVLVGRFREDGTAGDLLARAAAMDPTQTDLAASLNATTATQVVGVWPASDAVRHFPMVIGLELRLDPGIDSLANCDVSATFGPKSGPHGPITPICAGTGVWYMPKDDELVDGVMTASFTVTDARGSSVKKSIDVRVDRAPPRISRRIPEPGTPITDRQPVFMFDWNDPAGVDPDSLTVRFEPVKANYVRQVLVGDGRHKRGRMSGDIRWQAKARAVTWDDRPSGTVVTGAPSEIPVGTYRIVVTLSDKFGQKTEDSWEITVQ